MYPRTGKRERERAEGRERKRKRGGGERERNIKSTVEGWRRANFSMATRKIPFSRLLEFVSLIENEVVELRK